MKRFCPLIFLLLGAQIRTLMNLVPPGALGSIFLNGAVITLVAIVVRIIWVPLVTVCRRMSAETRRKEPAPRWKALFLVSWTSMRGVVSLATALALPRFLAGGEPFPHRTEIILATMCVIVLTLLLQGNNLTNEHAYRPRQYNGSAGELITAMPLARYNLTARFNFK